MKSSRYLPGLVLTVLLPLAALAADPAPVPAEPPVPAEGAPAPAFTLTGQDGSPVSLDQFRGKWVVLYFYPKDFTSGCTLQAQNFQRDIAKYEKANAVVVGVSLDSVDSHKDFCAKEGLSFHLLADTDHKVSSQYGSIMTHEGTEYSARNTFVIDPTGVLRKTYLKVKPAGHSEEVLADLTALQAAS